MTTPADSPERETLATWLTECVAAHVEMAPAEIKPAEPMSSYGLDSIGATSLLVQIEERVGRELDANVPWDYPTIDALTDFVLQLQPTDTASDSIGAV